MVLLNTYKQNNKNACPQCLQHSCCRRGFTLIEILIAITILGLILSFGMTVDINSLKGDTFDTEVKTIVSILERARSQAMANLTDTNHGVCYIEPNYVIFTGDDCATTDSELIPANVNIASDTSTTFPPKIIFERLTGRTTEANIHLSYSVDEANIKINHEGTIEW